MILASAMLVCLLLQLCSSSKELAVDNNLEAWLRSKRTAPQCCTADLLNGIADGIQEDLDILTQSVFEIGFNLQEFINMGMVEKYPAPSCSHLCYAKPGTPSGWYYIRGRKGVPPRRMYCDMDMQGSPFGSTQGWMKAIDFDMRRSDQHCPKGFTFLHRQGQRVCVKTVERGCQSISFPLYDIPYKRLCGRAGAFQILTNDAFNRYACSPCTINDPYVDGISITYDYPRKHIWSLAASLGIHEQCPCATGGAPPPKFVGNNYFCEVGLYNYPKNKFANTDPLWDGEGCGDDDKKCCEVPGLPWFCTDIPGGTNKDIEIRVCGDESSSNEDIYWQLMEIYVQ